MYLAEETIAYLQTKCTVTEVTEGMKKNRQQKNIQTSFKNVSCMQTFSKYISRLRESAYAERVSCRGCFQTALCLSYRLTKLFSNSFLGKGLCSGCVPELDSLCSLQQRFQSSL